jgi:hypothetical protein
LSSKSTEPCCHPPVRHTDQSQAGPIYKMTLAACECGHAAILQYTARWLAGGHHRLSRKGQGQSKAEPMSSNNVPPNSWERWP